MSTSEQTFLIVGAGLAGAKAAETLRGEGFDGRVVLIGAEPERPYERPPLSKEYLQGKSEREKVYVHAEGFYTEHEIELREAESVVSLDLRSREVELESGGRLGFDRLLLATGSEPRHLNIPGHDLDGVHYLRSLVDCDSLRGALDGASKLVVIGSGWIGAEVAASARQLGLEVTVIEPLSVPLERVLGPEVGAIYRDIHLEHGVEMRFGTSVEAIEGKGSVERVRTGDGQLLDCDAVVVGIGAQPRVGLAQAAGLDTDNGVLVDARLQASIPEIFAAGDIANHAHPQFGRLRVEHWANALNQGPAAAKAMLGGTDPYERVPYFFSDQYELGMEYSGYATEWDRVLFRGDPASREFIAFWLKGSKVLAGMNVNVWDVSETIQALVRGGEQLDEQRLADPDVPLSELLPERQST